MALYVLVVLALEEAVELSHDRLFNGWMGE